MKVLSIKSAILTIIFALLFVIYESDSQIIDTLFPYVIHDTIEIQKISPLEELRNDIDALIDYPDLADAIIGLEVQSLDRGDFIYRHNNKKNFTPASTQKLFTTAAALKYLGPDFIFTTRLYLDGTIQQNGEFLGNIIIRGSGDPSISPTFDVDPTALMDKWVKILDSLGIRSIRGNLIGDDSYFDEDYYALGWAWDDMDYSYSAQVNALSINDNVINISVQPGDSAGDMARFYITPENSYVQVINNIRMAGEEGRNEIDFSREQHTNIVELRGTLVPDTSNPVTSYEIDVSIENPTKYFLNLFKEALNRRSIRFRGALFDINDWNEPVDYFKLEPVCRHRSKPLSQIIETTNRLSLNLSAEMLLKTIAKEMSGYGSFEKGIDQLRKFISRVGIKPESIYLADGSGLSRYNLCAPAYQVALLRYMYRTKTSKVFMNSLPKPGEEGTLHGRMTKSRAQKNVIAKTGSMNHVSSICGYVTTRDKEALAFSIMIMNFTGPQSVAENLQDLICMRLASFSRK